METNSSSRTGRIGREMKRTAKNPNRGGGGGYGDRWKPPESGKQLTPMILFPGQYSMRARKESGEMEQIVRPYAVLHEHYSKPGKAYARCVAGLALQDHGDGNWVITPGEKNCVGCHEYQKGKESGVSLRKIHIFNGVLLANFHWIEKTSKRGTKYKEAAQCAGRRCKMCDQGVERSFGRRIYWPLGPSFVEQLGDFDAITLARECQCGGTIEPIAFECPDCKTPFRDLEDDPVRSEEELEELRDNVYGCSECSHRGLMDEVPECSDCREARSVKLWDVVMEVYRSGTGPTSSLQFSRHKFYPPERRAAISDLMKPIDVESVYPILNLNAQAKRLGKSNPFDSAGPGAGGNGTSEPEVDEPVPGSSAWDNL